MAVPKRRHSKARSAKRRASWKLIAPTLVKCPQCQEPRRPHRVCGHCGYYDGRAVIQVASEEA